MSFHYVSAAINQIVNSSCSRAVVESCQEACAQMRGEAVPPLDYCANEGARANLAACSDVCGRFALSAVSGTFAVLAVREGFRAVRAPTWVQTAGHTCKLVGWAGSAAIIGCLAQTSAFFQCDVTQYGRDCRR